MLFGKKEISLNQTIPTTPILYSVLFVMSIILFYKQKIIQGILVLLLILFVRMRSGKLILKDGDNIYIFGLPGSGKTMMLVKVAIDNKKRNICVNEELEHINVEKTVINKDLLKNYSFGSAEKGGLILWDEASLDGFDNRNFKTNFANKDGEELLRAFKKCRHRYTAVVIANQGYDEVDKKIRSGLCKYAYWVINKGWYSVAVRLTKSIKINEITGEPHDTYLKPTFWERIIHPSSYIYINHRKYGKYYKTINDKIPYYYDKVD